LLLAAIALRGAGILLLLIAVFIGMGRFFDLHETFGAVLALIWVVCYLLI
jgi:hypothetical protein